MKESRKDYEDGRGAKKAPRKGGGGGLDHFGVLAPFYEFFIRPRISAELLEQAGLQDGGILLDAGGGTGRVSQFLQEKAGLVVVADESCIMLREAGRKNGLAPVCSPVEKLPFGSRSIDRVVMVDALHHVADQQATCGELWRVLKPGGRLVIEEPDIRSFWVKLIALAEKLALMRSHFLSPAQIAALFIYPDASVRMQGSGASALVVVDKTGPAG